VEFVVNKVALRKILLSVLQISPVSIIPPMIHIHSFIHSFATDAIYNLSPMTMLFNSTLKNDEKVPRFTFSECRFLESTQNVDFFVQGAL
jgi:predicted subunit of tRNA(5-methylaminomethyl-2-thiouridylate) methyltransferase